MNKHIIKIILFITVILAPITSYNITYVSGHRVHVQFLQHIEERNLQQQMVALGCDPKFAEYLAPIVYSASRIYHIDPYILISLIKTESDFRLNVIGTSGEVGICQIIPKYWAARFNLTVEELASPKTNVYSCARILSLHKKKYGSIRQALRAYNGKSRRGTLYASRVLKVYKRM